jgi:hypothetical protein
MFTKWTTIPDHPILLDHDASAIFDGIQSGHLFARKFGKDSKNRKDTLDSLFKLREMVAE